MQIYDVLETTGETLNTWNRKETISESIQEQILDIDGKPVTETVNLGIGSETVTRQKYRTIVKQNTYIREIKGMSPKPQLVKSKICTTRKSPKAWGIYVGTDKKEIDYVLAGGTGRVRIFNLGFDVKQGDYFMSSDFKGGVELQNDDILHNYTLGKSLEDVVWEAGEQSREIACTLHGE